MRTSLVSVLTKFFRKFARSPIKILRKKPIVYNKRLVYEFPLHLAIPLVTPKVPVDFYSTSNKEPINSGQSTSADSREEYSVQGTADIYYRGDCNGEEVYHMWISFDKKSMAPLLPCADVPENAAFIYDCNTDAQYRGYAIYPAALTSALRYLQQQRVRIAYIRVHPQNVPSIRGIEKAGFRLCGNVYHLEFFGFQLKPLRKAIATSRGRY